MNADTASAPALNAWRSIWWRPQATIKDIVSRDDRSYVWLLAAIAGTSWAMSLGGSPYLHWLAVVAIALLIGPLFGILQLYLSGALLAWTGRLLGGRAGQPALRTAIAWASIPQVIALPVLLGSVAVFHQAFLSAYAGSTRSNEPAFVAIALILLLLSAWGLFLAVRTIGGVQHFGVIRSIANVLIPVFAVLAAALLIRIFLFQPFVIPAGSMVPSLLVGDYVYVEKFRYGYSQYSFPFGANFSGRIWAAEPERGDLVIFKLPRDPNVDYVKRIVGLPGDEIQMKGGVLHINGTEVTKVANGEFVTRQDGVARRVPTFEETLPNGVKFTVVESEPDGPFDNAGPYKVPAGHYFVMGDNLDNSMDSRALRDVGYVPYENLIGRVSVIYFSAGELGDTEMLANAFDNIRWHRIFRVPR